MARSPETCKQAVNSRRMQEGRRLVNNWLGSLADRFSSAKEAYKNQLMLQPPNQAPEIEPKCAAGSSQGYSLAPIHDIDGLPLLEAFYSKQQSLDTAILFSDNLETWTELEDKPLGTSSCLQYIKEVTVTPHAEAALEARFQRWLVCSCVLRIVVEYDKCCVRHHCHS